MREEKMVVMTKSEKWELDNKIQNLEKANEMLRKAVFELSKGKREVESDIRVSRVDFLKIYDMALEEMFNTNEDFTPENNSIYGHNFTVHWNGLYCNCCDGAVPSNYFPEVIKGIDDELCGEEW